jgi:Fe-S cluster biogenesis protein NfuA
MKDRIHKTEDLIAQIRAADDAHTRDAALELVQTVMEFHAVALDRIMEIAASTGDDGWRIIDLFALDDLVANLLILHRLHPLDVQTRVRNALENVGPYLQSHGGNLELVEIAGSEVRLRLFGSCNGFPSSSATLTKAIEAAIYETAPDVTSIRCESGTQLVSIQGAA